MAASVRIGEAVLEEEPFCHVLLQKLRSTRCDTCFTECEELKKCTGCSFMYYCNRVCQKRDWTVHKQECKCLKDVLPKIPMDSVRLLLRLVISQHLTLPMNNPWSRKLDDLMSHAADIKNDEERSEELAKMIYTLTRYAGKHVTLPSTSALVELFGKMLINTLTIHDGELNGLGTGIYLSGSKFNHDCSPNAVASFYGTTLVVHATQNIPDCSPEKVFISYIDTLAPRSERQTALQRQYFFTCSCSTCNNDKRNEQMLSFCCPNQGCSGAVGFIEEGAEFSSCSSCGAKDFPKHLKQGALQSLTQCKADLEAIKDLKSSGDMKAVLDQCRSSLKKATGVLHGNNIYLTRLLDYAMDAAIDKEEFELALKYGKKTLDTYKKFCQKYSPNLALQLFRVGKLELYMQDVGEAHRSLSEAKDILEVTHGKEHDTYRDVTLFVNQCTEEMRVNLEKST